MKLSIVIPCYNEAESIPLLLERLSSAVAGMDIEVILVNNGSTDNSLIILSGLVPRYPFARVVNVPVNQGYGYGILAGLKEARGEFLGWTHADLQTDPADITRAFHLIDDNGARDDIYIKGTRRGRGWFDHLFTAGMGLFESLLLGVPLWDINAQPNVFHTSFFAGWEKPPHDFALDLYAYYKAHRAGLKIARFPVLFPPRVHGTSHWNTGLTGKWKFIKRTVQFSLKMRAENI